MPSLTIKLGHIEVAYEGEQKFIESGLAEFLKTMLALPLPKAMVAAPQVPGAAPVPNGGSSGTLGHTTSLIAQMFSVNTGPDLIMAAAAHLTLVKGQDKIKRDEIRVEMKGAAGFFKDTYASNLGSSLANLVKAKKLNPISDGVYSLPNSIRLEYENKLKND